MTLRPNIGPVGPIAYYHNDIEAFQIAERVSNGRIQPNSVIGGPETCIEIRQMIEDTLKGTGIEHFTLVQSHEREQRLSIRKRKLRAGSALSEVEEKVVRTVNWTPSTQGANWVCKVHLMANVSWNTTGNIVLPSSEYLMPERYTWAANTQYPPDCNHLLGFSSKFEAKVLGLINRFVHLTDPQKIEAVLACIRAIHVMHRKNLIHKDLKPEQILIKPGSYPENPRFVLSDFDLVREEKLTPATVRGHTPKYAPWNYKRTSEYGKDVFPLLKSRDIFSFAITVIQILGGQVFIDNPKNCLEWRDKNYTPPFQISIPASVEVLLRAMLANDEKDRPKTEVVHNGFLEMAA